MIESFRALLYTILGALLTTGITFAFNRLSADQQSIVVHVSRVEIRNPIPFPTENFAEFVSQEINRRYRASSIPFDIGAIERAGTFYVYALDVKNAGRRRSEKIDMSFESAIFVSSVGGNLTGLDRQTLTASSRGQLSIPFLEPRQEAQILAVFGRVPFRSNPFVITAGGVLVEPVSAPTEGDLFGAVGFYQNNPFIAYLSIISLFFMFFIFVMTIYFGIAGYIFEKDVSRYKLITNNKEIDKYRRIISYIDKQKT